MDQFIDGWIDGWIDISGWISLGNLFGQRGRHVHLSVGCCRLCRSTPLCKSLVAYLTQVISSRKCEVSVKPAGP